MSLSRSPPLHPPPTPTPPSHVNGLLLREPPASWLVCSGLLHEFHLVLGGGLVLAVVVVGVSKERQQVMGGGGAQIRPSESGSAFQMEPNLGLLSENQPEAGQ